MSTLKSPPPSRPNPKHIHSATRTINPLFLNSPQFESSALNNLTGCHTVLKLETLNPIRCFKGRGTDYFVFTLTEPTHLVAASAGNFGQGLAYSGAQRGHKVTVFAATTANPLKVVRMRELGAEVRLVGQDFDEAKSAARHFAQQTNARFVEDGQDVAISEGAGTLAIELLRWPQALDAVVVPVGNGALVTGMGAWIKTYSPTTRVIGVCAQGADVMARAWRSVELSPSTQALNTIADGIAVRVPILEAVQDMRALVDEVLTVSDAQILDAMRKLFECTGIIAEPAGAAGLAAILAYPDLFPKKTVATPICGSNVTHDQLRTWF